MPTFLLKVIVIAESTANAQEYLLDLVENQDTPSDVGDIRGLVVDEEPKEIQL